MFGDLFSITGEQTCIPEISTKCDLYYHLVQSGEKKGRIKKSKAPSFLLDNEQLDFMECYTTLKLCNNSPVLEN